MCSAYGLNKMQGHKTRKNNNKSLSTEKYN